MSANTDIEIAQAILDNFPNNTSRFITPAKLREVTNKLNDSKVSRTGDTGIEAALQYTSVISISDPAQLVHKKYVDDAVAGVTVDVLGTALAGYASNTGTISSSDTVLSAINKLNGNSAALISDTAYDATTWDGVTTVGASKNALRDKFVLMDAAIAAGSVSDVAYDATTWDGVTTIGASKNALRDKFVLVDAAIVATVSDTAYNATSWNGVTTIAPSKNAVRDKIETLLPLAGGTMAGNILFGDDLYLGSSSEADNQVILNDTSIRAANGIYIGSLQEVFLVGGDFSGTYGGVSVDPTNSSLVWSDGLGNTSIARVEQNITTISCSTSTLILTPGTFTFNSKIVFTGTTHAGVRLNSLTTTQQNALTAANGDIIYNTSTNKFRAYQAGAWIDMIGGGGTGTVTSVTGTSNRISVATGTTTPVIDIDAAYVGQTSITTLGTIATGTWNATAIADGKIASALTGKTYNGLTVTTTTGTLTLTNAKTLSVTNTLTLSGTDSTVMTFPTTTATIARTDAGQTFTGTQAFGALTATSVTNSGLTSGRIPVASTAGLMADYSTLLYNGTSLNVGTATTAAGVLHLAAGTSALAAIQLTTQTTVTSPAAGQIWLTGTDQFNFKGQGYFSSTSKVGGNATVSATTQFNIVPTSGFVGLRIDVLGGGANMIDIFNVSSVSCFSVGSTGNVGFAGLLTCSNTTEATSATAGGSTFAGGVGINKKLFVTGATALASTLDVTGATTLSSTLGVTGVTTLAANGLVIGANKPTQTLFTQTADVTVSNTTATLLGTGTGTKTIAANGWAAGRKIRIVISGNTTHGVSPATSLAIKLGSTSLLSGLDAFSTVNSTNAPYGLEITITCRTIGVSGTFTASYNGMFGGIASTGTTTSTVTIDTTASQTIDVVATASSTDTMKSFDTLIEQLN